MNSFFPPFYILAGIVAGPFFLGLVTNTDVIGVLGEIGVVFLLLYLGYEFSLNTLIKRRKSILVSGSLDFLVNFAIGLAIGRVLGFNLYYSVIMAGIIYMSSSGIITKTLIQLNAVNDPEGQTILGIMVFEDLVMVIFLVIMSSLSSNAADVGILTVTFDLLVAVAFCVVIVLVAKKKPDLIDLLLDSKSKEVFLLVLLALVLGVTALGMQLGVSEALGAFFLGMLLSESKSKEKVENTILKFRDVFGGLFFFYFGMNFTLEGINISPVVLVTIIAAAVFGKLLSSFLIGKVEKCGNAKGFFIGLVTMPRGEFSLLIAGLVGSEVFNFDSFSIILILATSAISTLSFMIIQTLCNNTEVCLLKNRFHDE
jgi:CPA2 family monovalent cation:H+ antiporter-2